MPEQVASHIYMYAGDTKVFRSISNEIDSPALRHDLDQLVKWEQKWQLHFNADKCKVMHIGGDKNSNRYYMMKSVGLQNTREEKDFGVWINNDLKAFHVATAVSKANQTLGLIRRTFTHLDCQLMKQYCLWHLSGHTWSKEMWYDIPN